MRPVTPHGELPCDILEIVCDVNCPVAAALPPTAQIDRATSESIVMEALAQLHPNYRTQCRISGVNKAVGTALGDMSSYV